MLPQINHLFLVISPNLAKKKYFNVCDLEKNGVLHVKLTFETTLTFNVNAEAIFKLYFCRPYKVALPVLVTLSYLAKNFF